LYFKADSYALFIPIVFDKGCLLINNAILFWAIELFVNNKCLSS